MRNFLLFLTLHLFFSTNSQVILSGEVIGNSKFEIKLQTPIIGNFYNDEIKNDSIEVTQSNNFAKRLPIKRPSFINLLVAGQAMQLFVEPGDSIHLTIRSDQKGFDVKKDINIQGSNREGQLWLKEIFTLNQIKYQAIQEYFEAHNSKSEKEFVNFILMMVRNSSIVPDSLFKRKLITRSFFDYITKTLAASLLTEAVKPFIRPSKIREKFPDTFEKSFVSILFDQLNPLDTMVLAGNYSKFYAWNYLARMDCTKRNYYSNFEIEDSVFSSKSLGKKVRINKSFVPFLYISDLNIKEYLWGDALFTIGSSNPEDVSLDDINYYKAQFPQSPYLKYIYKIIPADLREKIGIKNKDITQKVILKNENGINTFASLISKYFSNKAVFVDIWATWCLPCRQEFRNNYMIDSILFSKNIKRLYISIDAVSKGKEWRKSIDNFNLTGYHFLAGPKFQDDLLRQFFDKDMGITIPRYLLINSNGKIITSNAPRPSDPRLKELLNETSTVNVGL